MSEDNVVDIKTRHPILNSQLREELEEGIAPFLENPEDKTKTITTLEQIVCAAIVSAASALAIKLANGVFAKIANR